MILKRTVISNEDGTITLKSSCSEPPTWLVDIKLQHLDTFDLQALREILDEILGPA